MMRTLGALACWTRSSVPSMFHLSIEMPAVGGDDFGSGRV